jgi:hypothetical protein
MSAPPRARTAASKLFIILGVAAAASFALFFLAGREYYLLPSSQRPFHPRHAALRPSGTSGLLFGVAGTCLMLFNLTYLARKRLFRIEWLGSLRSWMAFHVLTGLSGPALILLHTAFLPSSALGILSLSAMLVAVATGVAGRYIYAHVPRSIEGHEIELEDARRRLEEYHATLSRFGVQVRVEASAGARERPAGFLPALLCLLEGDRRSRRELRRLREAILASPRLRPRAREIIPLMRRLCKERQHVARFRELRLVMGSWRFFHRWLAIVMLLVAGFHIALAVVYGDLWVLRWRD